MSDPYIFAGIVGVFVVWYSIVLMMRRIIRTGEQKAMDENNEQ